MEEPKVDCPCKRKKCEFFGLCEECREHHRTVKKTLPYCERLKEKKIKKEQQKKSK